MEGKILTIYKNNLCLIPIINNYPEYEKAKVITKNVAITPDKYKNLGIFIDEIDVGNYFIVYDTWDGIEIVYNLKLKEFIEILNLFYNFIGDNDL